MHTLLLAGTERSGTSLRAKSAVLYVLCGSLALYPLFQALFAPVIALAYALVLVAVMIRLAVNGLRVPVTYLGWVWAIYGFIYIVWYAVALLHGNHGPYINQDSLGFLLYLGIMPVLLLYIRFNGLEAAFCRFVLTCCVIIAGASVLLVIAFYAIFGEIDSNAILLTNAFLAGLGMTWKIDHNSGVLGLYTNTCHLLLLGIALVLHRYSQSGRKKDLALAALFLVGIVFDGRRALAISAILQLLIVAPLFLRRMDRSRQVMLLAITALAVALTLWLSLDWLQARFAFSSDDPSTAERYAQIPALLDKIAENPVMGGGFGTFAAYIRSSEHPFSYEMDFLAVAMKLGLVGSLLYFGTYLAVVFHGYRSSGSAGVFLLSAGLPFFFFMGTNGEQAMSTDSSTFHIFLFFLIAFSARDATRRQPLPDQPLPAR